MAEKEFEMLNAVDLLNASAVKILFRLMIYRRMNSTTPAALNSMPEFSAPPSVSTFGAEPESADSVPTTNGETARDLSSRHRA
jgi:hypothetical protein